MKSACFPFLENQNCDLGWPKSELGSGLDQFKIGWDSELGHDIFI